MAWTALSFAFGSKLTSLKMTQLFDNLTALANGDSGAPNVVQAGLSTATGEVSTSSSANLTLPGGEYGFYPQVKKNVAGAADAQIVRQGAGSLTTSYATIIGLYNATTNTVYAQQLYIQASPPYDIGDGEVPLFIFALVNSLGEIEAVYCAPEPPWALNGPTRIMPTRREGGRAFRTELVSVPRPDPETATPGEIAAYLEALEKPQYAEIEITQALKQADMGLIPHPFIGNDLTGKTVALLDPVAPLTALLLELHEAGESINELLHEDWLRLDNVALPRSGPAGVMTVEGRWKNSA